jgi:hypothetical protein
MSGRDFFGNRALHRLVDFAASELESYQEGWQRQKAGIL